METTFTVKGRIVLNKNFEPECFIGKLHTDFLPVATAFLCEHTTSSAWSFRSYNSYHRIRKGKLFSPTGQEYPFLELSENFLSRAAFSAKALKAVLKCQSLLNIAKSCKLHHLHLLHVMYCIHNMKLPYMQVLK